MPRGAKTIENCAGHRTKKETEFRLTVALIMLLYLQEYSLRRLAE